MTWWLGSANQTTAKIVVRSPSVTGVLTATQGNVTCTGDTISSSYDYIGTVTVTSSGSWNLYVGGTYLDTATVKLLTSSRGLKIAASACQDLRTYSAIYDRLIDTWDIDAFFHLGDFVYSDFTRINVAAKQPWRCREDITTSLSSLTANKDVETYHRFYRDALDCNEILRFMQTVPFFFMRDDHEWYNDCAYDLTKFQAQGATFASATSTDLEDGYNASTLAFYAYSMGNPTRDPSGPHYFDLTIDRVHFIVIDCNSSDKQAPVAATYTTLLGATQLAWIKSRLSAVDADFHVILSPKQTGSSGATNGDSFHYAAHYDGTYTTTDSDIGSIAHHCNDNSITGVAWLAGDQHSAFVHYIKGLVGNYSHILLVGNPLSSHYGTSIVCDATNPPIWCGSSAKCSGTLTTAMLQCASLVEVADDNSYIDLSIVGAASPGQKLWSARLYAGEYNLRHNKLPLRGLEI